MWVHFFKSLTYSGKGTSRHVNGSGTEAVKATKYDY